MVLVIGQNSTWQKTYFLEHLNVSNVNRVSEAYESAAGKGGNVSRVLAGYGVDHRLIAYIGGGNGEKFAADCRGDGGKPVFIDIAEETRTCVTLIEEDHTVTELIEPSPRVTQSERGAFREAFARHIDDAGFLAIGGTAIRGEADDCYLQFVKEAHRRGIPVLLDSYRRHGSTALAAGPEILKINQDELAELSGLPVDAAEQRKAAYETIRRTFGIHWVIITRGARGAEGFNGTSTISALASGVTPVNPIGSGDAVAAGILSVLSREGRPFESLAGEAEVLERALVEGVAAGSANCLNWKPGRIDTEDLDKVRKAVEVCTT
ncbi:MAG: 1-phosphofructokinase family hexose kinase [Spirochaetaceae bacterium]